MTQGSTQVQVTGDVTATMGPELALQQPSFVQPGGGFAVTFASQEGDFFGIGGGAFTGSQPTSGLLTVSLSVVDLGTGAFFFGFSLEGECTVTVDSLEEASVSGSVTCTGLSSGDASVDLTATFQASA